MPAKRNATPEKSKAADRPSESAPEASPPVEEPIDPNFLPAFRETLTDAKDGERATRAAIIAPPAAVFDAAALADQSFALEVAIVDARLTRRKKLLEAANGPTLINAEYVLFPTEKERSGNPVFRELHEARRRYYEERYGPSDRAKAEAGREAAERAMSDARKRSGCDCPALPATSKDILLWVTGLSPERWVPLEKAFLDFLTLVGIPTSRPLDHLRAKRGENEKFRQTKLITKEGKVVPFKEFPPSMLEEFSRHDAEYADLDFYDGFKPGDEAPIPTRKAAEETYQRYNQEYDEVISVEWLALDFWPFWEKHGKVYREMEPGENAALEAEARTAKAAEAEERRKAKEKRQKKERETAQGNVSREGTRALKIFRHFLESHAGEKIELSDVLAYDPKGVGISKRKAEPFLTALLEADQPLKSELLKASLGKAGIVITLEAADKIIKQLTASGKKLVPPKRVSEGVRKGLSLGRTKKTFK
jgi:hypothetical protein